jgi:NAD+ kinase
MLKSNDKIALNDIIIKGANQNRTSTLSLYINEKLLCSYVADGLIISTPTGSTAYSLSAGGPIISPDVDCFLVTPICPHTLNTRPVVIPSNEKITVKILENTQKLNVVFDGQSDLSLDNEVTIEKNNKHAKLIVLNQQKDRFYDILKEKLHWSLAPRK